MIPELGQVALILALISAIVLAAVPMAGSFSGDRRWMATALPACYAQLGCVAVAFAALAWAFYARDFSVQFVANHSNAILPWYYRLTAVWGGHEGSLLLWMLLLGLWTAAVAHFSRRLPSDFTARVLSVMGMVSVGFLLFTLLTSNPFDRVLPAMPDGRDLNPLLQDPGMIIHPPMLYMGYVGFSVPFAFAVAALLGGRLERDWARWARPWTTVAWGFLTLGITLGSWWAYYELGWGGWWFWDPVENASFMPWLVGTALIHSQAVTEQRGSFRGWTVLLAIIAFSLSLLGTFLVRSGVLTSVHAFAQDPERGLFILVFLGLVTGGSLTLYALRAPRVAGGEPAQPVSRETMLLINNLLFAVAGGTVLLGTLYPLALDALGLGKISVGPPYFGFMFTLLLVPVIALLPIGPYARWRRDDPGRLLRRMWLALAAAALGAIGAPFMLREVSPFAVAGLAGGVWVIAGTLDHYYLRLRSGPRGGLDPRTVSRGVTGMTLAHLGVGLFVMGVVVSSTQNLERDLVMAPGQSETLGRYTFRFDGVRHVPGPNFESRMGTVTVSRNGREFATLNPEKRRYSGDQVMTEAAIHPQLWRDIYVALGTPVEGGTPGQWSIRLYYKPFIRFIWLGALMMMLGGFLAASDPRYRTARRRQAAVRDVAAEGVS